MLNVHRALPHQESVDEQQIRQQHPPTDEAGWVSRLSAILKAKVCQR